MFPGHPYLRQETRKAEHQGERLERDRVLRLIDARLRTMGDESVVAELQSLRRAVQQGHQR